MQVVSPFSLIVVVLVLVARSERTLASPPASTTYNDIYATFVQTSIDALIQESLDDISAKMKEFQKDARRSHRRCRPFVTLAYAQSIDGKIALIREKSEHETKNDEGCSSLDPATTTLTSSNFAISGPESLRLTHALRSIHDAILIGGNTLSVDNPRLSNRLWPSPPPPNESGNTSTVVRKQPVPVILDTHLNHVRSLGINAKAKQHTIVCCSAEAYQRALEERYCDPNQQAPDKESRNGATKGGGVMSGGGGSIPSSVTLLPCKTKIIDTMGSSGSVTKGTKVVLDLSNVMSKLHRELGIDSLMVEGGASVLSQFVGDTFEIENEGEEEEEYNNNQELFDCLCVTISPKLLGANGLDSMSCGGLGGSKAGPILGPLKCITLGDDCVLFADRQS